MRLIGGLHTHLGRHATHTALLYSSEQEYLDGLRGFLAHAVEGDSPVVIAAPKLSRGHMHERLGLAAERTELLDVAELGTNPARIIPAMKAAVDAHPAQSVFFVVELTWAGRAPEEVCEAMRHEALVNRAFGSARAQILCPFDLTTLDATIVADAERTHPTMHDSHGTRSSRCFSARRLPPSCQDPLSPPPDEAASLQFELGDLPLVRSLVSEQAARARLPLGQCGDVVLAVDELATNSVRHGGGGGIVRAWHEDGRLTCEVSDAGQIGDPLAGCVRPKPGAHDGRGLWLVNQLCDLVQLRTSRAGTTIRISAARHGSSPAAARALVGAQAGSAAGEPL